MGLGQPDDIAEALSRSFENKALRDPANLFMFAFLTFITHPYYLSTLPPLDD